MIKKKARRRLHVFSDNSNGKVFKRLISFVAFAHTFPNNSDTYLVILILG